MVRIRVSGWGMYYVSESSHDDRSTKVCVFLCVLKEKNSMINVCRNYRR